MKKNYLLIFICLLYPSKLLHSQTLIKDINPGQEDGFVGDHIFYKDKIYFSGGVSAKNPELWVTDGTEDGTYLFKDMIPGAIGADPQNFKVFNDTLFFEDSQGNYWFTDGTQENTMQLATDFDYWNSVSSNYFGDIFIDVIEGERGYINTGFAVTKSRNGNIIDTLADAEYIYSSIYYNDELYFCARKRASYYMGVKPYDIYFGKTDGTKIGTEILLDQLEESILEFVIVNNKLLFQFSDSNYGREPFISDGTKEGTKLLKDINPDTEDSNCRYFVSNGEKAVFYAYEGVHGFVFWITDGTEEGTHVIDEIFDNSSIDQLQSSVDFIDTVFILNVVYSRNGYKEAIILFTDGNEYVEKLDYNKYEDLYPIDRKINNSDDFVFQTKDYGTGFNLFKILGIHNIINILSLPYNRYTLYNPYIIGDKIIHTHTFDDYGIEWAYDSLIGNHMPEINLDTIFFSKSDAELKDPKVPLYIFDIEDTDGDSLIFYFENPDYTFRVDSNNLYTNSAFWQNFNNRDYYERYLEFTDGILINRKLVTFIMVDDTENPTIVNEKPMIDKLIIYPNPNYGSFIIDSEYKGVVSIYSVLGELLYSKDFVPNETINFHQEGVFIVQIQTQGTSYIKRMVIN